MLIKAIFIIFFKFPVHDGVDYSRIYGKLCFYSLNHLLSNKDLINKKVNVLELELEY